MTARPCLVDMRDQKRMGRLVWHDRKGTVTPALVTPEYVSDGPQQQMTIAVS